MTDEKEKTWFGQVTPIHLESRNSAFDKKLIMTVAPTGAFLKRHQNPDIPYLPAEVARHVIDSYKLGASVWHVHLRDKEGLLSKDVKDIIAAADMILDECPDILLSQSGHWDSGLGKRGREGVKTLVEPLLNEGARKGRRYIHTMVVSPATVSHRQVVDQGDLQDIVAYLQENGIVPEFQNADLRGIRNVIEWLIEPGILKLPAVMNLLLGYHGYRFVSTTEPQPWSNIYLMTMIEMLPKGSVVGATIGGRYWLPLTVQSILLNADCVRIGMEDNLFMYPHKDIKINSCAEVIGKVATITRELGRDIASPAEALQIFGCGQIDRKNTKHD